MTLAFDEFRVDRPEPKLWILRVLRGLKWGDGGSTWSWAHRCACTVPSTCWTKCFISRLFQLLEFSKKDYFETYSFTLIINDTPWNISCIHLWRGVFISKWMNKVEKSTLHYFGVGLNGNISIRSWVQKIAFYLLVKFTGFVFFWLGKIQPNYCKLIQT